MKGLSTEELQRVIDRVLEDEAFRDQLARDPVAALAGFDLTKEERASLRSGSARAERLDPRISRNDLSAAFAVKTGGIDVRPPSDVLTKREGRP